MKSNWGKEIIKSVKEKGYIEHEGMFYPPNSEQGKRIKHLQANASKKKKKRSNLIKTGWTDDDRNIRNKEKQRDVFMMLIEKEFGLQVWPEFYFSLDRLYRFDYCIPVDRNGNELKIAIEVNGGVWSKGNSGHSSGKGIMRDYDKNNLAQSLGWNLINVTPDQLLTNYTLNLIANMINTV